MMPALELLAAQERVASDMYAHAVARAIAHTDEGRTVPPALLDEIAMLEGRIGVLVTLQLSIELRLQDGQPAVGNGSDE